MYKYYYELEYFPIPEVHEKKYLKISAKGQSPKIKNKIANGIYEVEDDSLFYTSSFDEFNVLIYKFALPNNPNINVQVTRYKKIRTSTYSLCVKSSKLIPKMSVITLPFNTDILKPVTFDINKYGRINDPAYLVKKDGITIDILSIDGTLYSLNGNYGVTIGELKSKINPDSKVGLFAKGELMQAKDTIYIFDAYIIDGQPLDIPYKERMNKMAETLNSIKLDGDAHIKGLFISQVHNRFEDAYEESQKMPNDGIIIQGPTDEPLKWKPSKANTIDVLVEDDLYLTKGLDQILTFKVIRNPSFNMKVIWDYRNKYAGEIIEIGIDGSFHRVRYDKLKPNAIRTYKSTLEQSNTIDKSVMLGDERLVKHVFHAYKELLLDKYVHGETIEINIDCAVINKINILITEDKITGVDINRASNFDNCKVEHVIHKKIVEYLETEKHTRDTFVVELSDQQDKPNLDFVLDRTSKLLTDCGKIILFDTTGEIDVITDEVKKHNDLEILEIFKLSDIPNKETFSGSNFTKLSNLYNAVVIRKSKLNIKPEFIFIVGLMGSGKSRLIDQVRNFVHPSSALNIINTDVEVTKFISYQLSPDEHTYKSIRKILDPINDEQIETYIKSKQSILLETTHIDEDYAINLSKTHKTIAIICNTSLAQIESNIEARNRVNIRKTTIDKDRYNKFQSEIATYTNFIDMIYDFDMGKIKSSGDSIKELHKIKGGAIDLIDGGNAESLIEYPESKPSKLYLKLSDLDKEKPYEYNYKHVNKGVHYGQRKLLIGEIMFLTMMVDPDKTYNVIYAGSAPCLKYPVLRELFKNCRFILIDPNPFSKNVIEQPHLYFKNVVDMEAINKNSHIRTVVINDLCTMELIERLSILENILFISDIRTNLLTNEPLEYDILFNIAQHKAWLDILYAHNKDLQYMLKSRCTYNIDQSEHYEKFIKIVGNTPEWKLHGETLMTAFELHKPLDIDGERYLQPWKGAHSTEVRAIGNNPEFVKRDELKDEKLLFYYNTELRINDDSKQISGVEAFGFKDENIDVNLLKDYCGCNDCGIELYWIKEYVKKFNSSYNKVINLINKYSQSIKDHKSGISKVHEFKFNMSKKRVEESFNH